MGRVIFLLDEVDKLVEMREMEYDSEDLLQRLLATHPDLMAGDQINSRQPRRWLLVTREARIPDEEGASGRWSVDHLFLDQDAVPTLVEVKRSSDTRIRREVVGQLLDYAANAVVYWPIDHLRARFESVCEEASLNPDDELGSFLGPEGDPEAFWQLAKTNLQAGKIRLLFVADEIPSELRRIVEFLNQQMDPAEVLAVEIKQFVSNDMRTLVPRVIGQTEEAQTRKGRSAGESRQWDEESFFEHLASQRPVGEVEAARNILTWAQKHTTRVWWGRGSRAGSMVPILEHCSKGHQPFAVWSSGSLEVYFYWYAHKPPFDDEKLRLELLRRLNEIPRVSLDASVIAKRPNIPLEHFVSEASRARLFETFEWYIEQILRT